MENSFKKNKLKKWCMKFHLRFLPLIKAHLNSMKQQDNL